MYIFGCRFFNLILIEPVLGLAGVVAKNPFQGVLINVFKYL